MLGDSQNVVISNDVLDAIFKNVEDCKNVVIGSGESLLHIDLLDNLVNRIVESSWRIKELLINSNGTILDEKVISILDRLCRAKQELTVYLRFSRDPFHPVGMGEQAVEFYKKINSNPNIHIIYVGQDLPSPKLDALFYSGKVKKLVEDHPEVYDQYRVFNFAGIKHKIGIYGDRVLCLLRIGANGNVGFDENIDLESFDKLAMGNILNTSLAEIIESHNSQCLIGCDELYDSIYPHLDWANMYLKSKKRSMAIYGESIVYEASTTLRIQQILNARIGACLDERTIKMRESAKERFPFVPTDVIIQQIPLSPVNDNIGTYFAADLLNHSFSKDELSDIIDPETMTAYSEACEDRYADPTRMTMIHSSMQTLAMILQEQKEGKEEDYTKTPEFKALEKINDTFKHNPPPFESMYALRCSNYIATQEQEEAAQMRCEKCHKVIRNNRKNIHCREIGNDRVVCDYCGHEQKITLST